MNLFWKTRIKLKYVIRIYCPPVLMAVKKFRESPWLVKLVEFCRLTGTLLECDPKHRSLSLEWSYVKLPNAQTCRKPNPLLLYQVIDSLVFIPSRSRHDHLEGNPFSRPFPGFIVLMKIPQLLKSLTPLKECHLFPNITLLRVCLGTARVILFLIFFTIFKLILDIKIGKYKWYVYKGVLLLFWRKISSSTPLQSGFSTWPLTGG